MDKTWQATCQVIDRITNKVIMVDTVFKAVNMCFMVASGRCDSVKSFYSVFKEDDPVIIEICCFQYVFYVRGSFWSNADRVFGFLRTSLPPYHHYESMPKQLLILVKEIFDNL